MKNTRKKFLHWGHSHQFDREEWFQKKWLKWNESTQNLHPLNRNEWKKAVKYNGPLPRELLDFEEPRFVPYETNLSEKIADKWYDMRREFRKFIL